MGNNSNAYDNGSNNSNIAKFGYIGTSMHRSYSRTMPAYLWKYYGDIMNHQHTWHMHFTEDNLEAYCCGCQQITKWTDDKISTHRGLKHG